MIIVVFGRSGAGKDTALKRLPKKYFIYNGDSHRTERYKEVVAAGGNPSRQLRNLQCWVHINNVIALLKKHPNIIVNWVFQHESQREMWREAFPETIFIYITSPINTIEKRLTLRPRKNHPNTTAQTMKVAQEFEEPTSYNYIIFNTGNRAYLKESLIKAIPFS